MGRGSRGADQMVRARVFPVRGRGRLGGDRPLRPGGLRLAARYRSRRPCGGELDYRCVSLQRRDDPGRSSLPQRAGCRRVRYDRGRGCRVRGLAEHKEDPDDNAMYRFELGGISVLHMGDTGNPLTGEQLRELRGRVDVLLALVGGPPTIELEDLDRAIEEIGPRVVVPMHYRIPGLRISGVILPVDAFLSRYPREVAVHQGSSEVELTPDSLPPGLRICVLEP